MSEGDSYSEAEKGWVYDWPACIYNLENHFLNEDEKAELIDASASWVTCACGAQCDIIPRDEYENGAPKDPILLALGQEFYEEICNLADKTEGDGDGDRARKILDQIEKRSATLIKRIHEDADQKSQAEDLVDETIYLEYEDID